MRARVGVVDDRAGAAGAEEVPRPRHEGVDPLAHAAHQPGVHAEPGGEARRGRAARGGGRPSRRRPRRRRSSP